MPGIFQLKANYFLGFQYLYKFWNYYCTSTTVLLLVKLKVSKGFDKICAVVQWSVSLLQKSKKWNGKPIMACCNVQHLGVGHGCQNEEKWVSYLVAQSTKKGNDWACTDRLVGKATTRTEKSWWCPKRSETPSCLRHHDLCTQTNIVTMPMTSHDTPPIAKTGEKCGKTKHLTISFDGREETVVSKPLELFQR